MMGENPSANKQCLAKVMLQALGVRLILVCHALIAVWRLSILKKDDKYWLILGLINVLHIPETLYTLIRRRGMEAKWVCTCFVIYLGSVVPATWLLELNRLHSYLRKQEELENNTVMPDLDSDMLAGVSIPIMMDNDTWVSFIEQSLLFILIVGRWFLPRGELTRNQLSQLLFVFIGMGSDIMELFVLFEEPEIRGDKNVTLVILIIWTVSLVQFCLVLTATKNSKKGRAVAISPESNALVDDKTETCKCLETEVWSLLVSLTMQDGPFLCIRLYVLLEMKVRNYSIFFFIAKNSLLVALILYRLSVVVCDIRVDSGNDNDNDKKRDMPTPTTF